MRGGIRGRANIARFDRSLPDCVQPAAFSLLRILNAGGFHAREALARALQVTPAAIDEAAAALQALGVACRADAACGYALTQSYDLLDAHIIAAALRERGTSVRVLLRDECASTNTLMRQCATDESIHGLAIACELQSAGRGRRGNVWHTGLGEALTFTLGWCFTGSVQALGGLPLAAAVACVRGLDALGARGIALKWPNDLMHEGAKLGGILIETFTGRPGCIDVLIGVGINVHGAEAARGHAAQPVTHVAAIADGIPSRNLVLARVLAELEAALQRYAAHGFAAFRGEWLRRHAFEGRRVRVMAEGERCADGVAQGVAEDGALLVRTDAGVRRFHAGEVSLREAP